MTEVTLSPRQVRVIVDVMRERERLDPSLTDVDVLKLKLDEVLRSNLETRALLLSLAALCVSAIEMIDHDVARLGGAA